MVVKAKETPQAVIIMSSIISTYLSFASSFLLELKAQQEAHKAKILVEWENSKNYPRKKKKEVRKHLQLEWNIACFNPFD